jgi:hypothetical protein
MVNTGFRTRHRLLEDHRHLVAAQRPHLRLGQREQVDVPGRLRVTNRA